MGIAEAYDPDTRWGRAFGVVDRENYSPPLYQHRGQDIRKLEPGGRYSVATDVLSLSVGVVSHQFTARATGREVVVDTGRGRGRYEIHCHSAYFPGVGTRLDAGSTVTRNATAGESPGTGWDAPHDHFVISDYPDAAHTPSRPVYDPRPFILSALAGAAGDTARPFTPEEDDMYEQSDRDRDNAMAAKVDEIRTILYNAGLGEIRENAAAAKEGRDRITEVRDILYNAGLGEIRENVAALAKRSTGA
ncbi:hypothetical protein [Microbacterium sp. 69-7]|uniref:hypothetical protein n=1 Tax=Microbacterium sp. 69-7 TaxID=1895784 RepID=UPI000AC5D750|nr:hypothetical protein [Microbacterium sp. 69-7]